MEVQLPPLDKMIHFISCTYNELIAAIKQDLKEDEEHLISYHWGLKHATSNFVDIDERDAYNAFIEREESRLKEAYISKGRDYE